MTKRLGLLCVLLGACDGSVVVVAPADGGMPDLGCMPSATQTRVRYERAQVEPGESCRSEMQTRTCDATRTFGDWETARERPPRDQLPGPPYKAIGRSPASCPASGSGIGAGPYKGTIDPASTPASISARCTAASVPAPRSRPMPVDAPHALNIEPASVARIAKIAARRRRPAGITTTGSGRALASPQNGQARSLART